MMMITLLTCKIILYKCSIIIKKRNIGQRKLNLVRVVYNTTTMKSS